MAEFTFAQYQAQMKPIEDLVLGIVKIVSAETPEKELEVGQDLLTQIMISALVMHLSEKELMNQLPETEAIEKMIEEKRGEAFLKLFSGDLTQEKLFTYLQDSASVVMSLYFEKIKNQMTPDKTAQIQTLFQAVEAKLRKQ